MYIAKTTKQVIDLFDKIENLDDNGKLKLLIYLFNEVNNNQLNSKNEANPDLVEDDDMVIFTFEDISVPENFGGNFLNYFILMYNHDNPTNQYYEDNGHVMGVSYTKEEKEVLSGYENLSFYEKLDALAELIMRYDNETLMDSISKYVNFGNGNGYEIACKILSLKDSYGKN